MDFVISYVLPFVLIISAIALCINSICLAVCIYKDIKGNK